jgi:hypothetical protein
MGNDGMLLMPSGSLHRIVELHAKGRIEMSSQSISKLLFLLLLPLSALAQSDLVVKSLNRIQFADQFPGADACIQIQNAIAALPVNGGEVDARGFLGFLTCSVNPFANILNHPGESVHLYLAAGSTFTTSAQWMIPLGSVVTGGGSVPGGGRGTTLIASSAFPTGTPVVYLGDFSQSGGSLIENITIDCNHIAGSIGIFSDRVQELGGARNVSVVNYQAIGIEMLDQANLPPGTGGFPENYILDQLQLGGDAGSTCLQVRVGAGGQRGAAHITCSTSLLETFSLSCSAGVVTATFIPPPLVPSAMNTIPNGASIGVESGPNPSLDGIFTVTSSSSTQLQWSQPGCSGTSSGVGVGVMVQNGVQLDGSDGVYSQIHCEFTVDCVLINSDSLQDGWVTRALSISGVTGQSSVKNIVHLETHTNPEDIILTALQRCNGPNPATTQCATNVLQDDFNTVTLQDASLAWYFIGHSSSGPAPALFSSSPSVAMFLANPFVIFRNHSFFSQLGGQNDGSFTYCADCTVATPSACSTANPSACVCAGGGTGAFAKRVNGAWFCN